MYSCHSAAGNLATSSVTGFQVQTLIKELYKFIGVTALCHPSTSLISSDGVKRMLLVVVRLS